MEDLSALQAKGLQWGTGGTQGLLGSSACFSRTVTEVVLDSEAHRIKEQGDTPSVAPVVAVKKLSRIRALARL